MPRLAPVTRTVALASFMMTSFGRLRGGRSEYDVHHISGEEKRKDPSGGLGSVRLAGAPGRLGGGGWAGGRCSRHVVLPKERLPRGLQQRTALGIATQRARQLQGADELGGDHRGIGLAGLRAEG